MSKEGENINILPITRKNHHQSFEDARHDYEADESWGCAVVGGKSNFLHDLNPLSRVLSRFLGWKDENFTLEAITCREAACKKEHNNVVGLISLCSETTIIFVALHLNVTMIAFVFTVVESPFLIRNSEKLHSPY